MIIKSVPSEIVQVELINGTLLTTKQVHTDAKNIFHSLPSGFVTVCLKEPKIVLSNCNKCMQVENQQPCGDCCEGKKSECEHSQKCPNNCKENKPLSCSKLFGLCCKDKDYEKRLKELIKQNC